MTREEGKFASRKICRPLEQVAHRIVDEARHRSPTRCRRRQCLSRHAIQRIVRRTGHLTLLIDRRGLVPIRIVDPALERAIRMPRQHLLSRHIGVVRGRHALVIRRIPIPRGTHICPIGCIHHLQSRTLHGVKERRRLFSQRIRDRFPRSP